MSLQTGFSAARNWCLAVEAINQEANSSAAEQPNYSRMAAMIEEELKKPPEHRAAFLLALSEFASLALEGCVVAPKKWKPLE